ncbi:hypothetical protein AB0L40_13380 [Patulibacter sp. NPDC049589]|uniref:hypothetical protein n=1 Tax=Patulibacter sp. NPDC049589 TaxID=3154731 RepID=UPI00341793CE
MRLNRTRSLALLGATAALALAGCGGDDGGDTETSAATTSTAAKTTAAADGGISQATIDTALKFTGGKAGKAGAGDPIVVGVVNQQGAAPAFPEYLDTANAATKFVNADLGGAGGRPLKLEPCIVQSEEDGQKCAAEFLSKKIDIAVWTLGIAGNGSFYKTVGGKFPVLVSAAATGPDSTTPHVYEFDGGANSTLNAFAVAATKIGKKVAIVATGNDSGKFTTGEVLMPMLKKLGADTKVAYYPDTATTPEMVSAVQASGAASADVVIFNPAAASQCNSVYDAMKQLGVEKPVVTSSICAADEVADHTGGGPEGWTFASYASNPRVTADADGQAFKNALETYGAPKAVNSGYTLKTFGDLLAIVKWTNEIGADKVSPATYESAIKAFKGPAFGVPGPMSCGSQKGFVSVCGSAARMSTYKGGTWSTAGDVPLG